MTVSKVLGLVATTALVLTTAACGGGSDAKEAGADGLTKVTLAAVPAGQVGTMVLGQQEGIFEKHGIDLEFSYLEPTAIVPSIMSGDSDFAWFTAPGLLTARANNVPLKSVATMSTAGNDPETFPTQLLVSKDSTIKTADDLAGKTVATASLFQLPDLALMSWLQDAGIDPKDVDFVEVPFPNMGEALGAGKVDAVLTTEPFLSITKATIGAVRVMSISEGVAPEAPISVMIASDPFIAENPDLVDDFRAAVDEATTYAAAHEGEVRATLPSFTELEPELAKSILLAPVDTTDDADAWAAWADLLVDVGAIDTKPDSSEAFIED